MVAGAFEPTGEDRETGATTFRWWRAIAARQEGRAFLWSPIALTFGIWTYFTLATEPSIFGTAAIALLGLALLWLGRSVPILSLVALLALGFALAKLRSDVTATPLLRATTAEVLVTGRVVKADTAAARRLTIILEVEEIAGQARDRTPKRLRLSASTKLGEPKAGTRIEAKAFLSPLPTPVQPGGFDYGQRLWFEGIGGTGRIAAPIVTLDPAIPWTYWLDATLADIRRTMGERIRAVLDEPLASFAEALITGERSTIPKDLNQSLLVSGLFHILSISGLHMWLVVGGVFWTARAALALVPRLALGYPIKKWAAGLALGMGLFYMLLADSGVATQRSFIMIAVVFFAVMADRPALSARNLAIAAIVVLILEPEAAIEASFQMSFLAVLGLVAFYEAWSRLMAGRDGEAAPVRHWLWRLGRKLLLAAAISVLTTLVAGTMSSIPAAYHFGRMAPFSVIANGLALPVIGVLVMPMALLSAVLMPLGLEALPLWVMGQGLRLVLLISDWVAGFPGAYVIVPQSSGLAVTLMACGAAVLCLLAGTGRWSGLALMGLGAGLAFASPDGPDILIERTGQNVAIRDAQGLLVPARPRRARFTVEKWLQVNGEEITPADAVKRRGWTCNETRCESKVKAIQVVFVSGMEGKHMDCAGIDILIADFPLRGLCRNVPLRIDRFDLWRKGAHAITIASGGTSVTTARGSQGARPWVVVPEARVTPYRPLQPRAFSAY